jgi:AraC-like DNA-binding protein
MRLDYKLDISEKSVWLVTNSGEFSEKLPFYLNEAGDFYAGGSHYTEREGQSNYFIMHTVSGRGFLRYESKEFILEPGTAVMINCENYQRYGSFGGDWRYRWVHFNGTAAESFYEIINSDGVCPVNLNDKSEFMEITEKIFGSIKKTDVLSNVLSSQYITGLCSIMAASKFTEKSRAAHKYEIENAVSYIDAHFGEKITVDSLAALSRLSKFYFLNLFKKHMGMTPYEYILHRRIIQAKKLLRGTDLAVYEIAEAAGFNAGSHFTASFKKITSMTPREYRTQ